MGSYAYITIDGYPIDSSKNHFSQWFFKKSDRKVMKTTLAKRNRLIWLAPEPGEADQEVEEYVYEITAPV